MKPVNPRLKEVFSNNIKTTLKFSNLQGQEKGKTTFDSSPTFPYSFEYDTHIAPNYLNIFRKVIFIYNKYLCLSCPVGFHSL